MNASNEKNSKPRSNPTSSLARGLLTQTLEHLAETDSDHSLKQKMRRRRQKMTQDEGR